MMNKWKRKRFMALVMTAAMVLTPQTTAMAAAVDVSGSDAVAETVFSVGTTSGEDSVSDSDVSGSDVSGSDVSNPDVSGADAAEEVSEGDITPSVEAAGDPDQATGAGTVTFSVSGSATSAVLSEGASGISVTKDETTGTTLVAITASGNYTFTGTAKNTYVTVKKSTTDVTIVLDELTIDDSGLAAALGSDSPVISCGKNSAVTINLANTSALTGSSTFVKEPEAVIKASTSAITFTGTGTLTVTDAMAATTDFTYEGASVDPADAISAKTGTVTFTSGTVKVSANGSGVKAKQGTINVNGGTLIVISSGDDAVKAKDGTINITSGAVTVETTQGDGIKAGMEEISTGGNVNISGGTVTIDECYGDGIQGENVNISGGKVDIKTVFDNAATGYYTSGSSTTLNTISESGNTKTERVNVDTGSHKGIKAGTKAATKIYTDLLTTNPPLATESVAASGGLTISGGTITIDTTQTGLKANSVSASGTSYNKVSDKYTIGAPDGALQSNSSLSITGGTITIASADEGIGAADTIEITGTPTIKINTAYEGMEAGSIIIGSQGGINGDYTKGPDILINSLDDGINASSKTLVYTYDSSEDTDCNYTKVSSSKSDNFFAMYSGKLEVRIDSQNSKSISLRNGSASSTKTITYSASGDGLDSNGTITIDGGTVYVFGETGSGNSPIDQDTGFELGSHAIVLAAGGAGMASESIPEYGTGVYLTSLSSSSSESGAPGSSGGPGSSSGPGSSGGPGGSSSSSISISAGSVFKVANGGTTIFGGGDSITFLYDASFFLFASPDLVSGTSYTVTIGSSSQTISASKPSNSGSPSTTTVNSVTLSKSSLTLDMGKSTSLTATVSSSGSSGGMGPGGGQSSATVAWTSSDPTVAVVAGTGTTGTVYGRSAGTTTITAASGDKSASCTVTVSPTLVTSVTLDQTTLELETGTTGDLSATVLPIYASNQTLTWDSTNKEVATVENGTVKALKAGTTTITATTSDGSKLSASCAVKVYDKTTVTLNQESLRLENGTTATLTATVTTSDGSKPAVTWSSSADAKVSVTTDGTDDKRAIITAHANGKAVITASVGDVSASCTVTVYTDYTDTDYRSGQDDRVETTTYDGTDESGAPVVIRTAEMVKGQKTTLEAGLWSTSDSKIATVAKKTGVVTAKKAGTVTLTNAASGAEYKITKITVYEPALYKDSASLKKITLLTGQSDDSIQLKNTGDMAVSWISANASVVSVTGDTTEDGTACATVTAVGKGSAKVYAYVGGKAYAFTVVVKDVAASVKLADEASIDLNVFQTYVPKFTSGFKTSGASWTDENGTAWTQDAKGNWSAPEGEEASITITKAGKITGTAVGETTVKGTDKNGKAITLTVNVKAFSLKTDVYLNVGQKTTLKHTYVKNNKLIPVAWTADDDGEYISLTNADKAKVTIKGEAVGETTLICSYNDVTYETCVHVEDPALADFETEEALTPVKANTYNYTMDLKVGETFQIYQPDVFQTVVFKSSKKKVAFVSEYGVIEARAKGKAVISAKVNGKTVKITVNVTE